MCPQTRALSLVALATACARAPEPRTPESPGPAAAPAPAACIAAGTPGVSADSLHVVLDPAPRLQVPPTTGAEWFVAAHAHEPLVRLDCAGAIRPGLADRWTREADGSVWTFTLRDGAAMSDGSPVLASTIAEGWRAESLQQEHLRLAGVTAVDAAGVRVIRLTLAEPADSVAAILADPVLATVTRRGTPSLPGTGAWRAVLGADSTTLTFLEPARPDRSVPVLRLLPRPADLRDALDAGADLVVTADPVTLAYARTRPSLELVPLPWTRTYVLLSAAPFAPAESATFRASLARDAVRQDARAAAPEWWHPACQARPAAATPRPVAAPRIAYPEGDSTGAELAARLVALGAAGRGGSTEPMNPRKLLESVGASPSVAVLMAFPRTSNRSCLPQPTWLKGWSLTTLIDTRAYLIARRDGPALEVDGLGAIRLAPAQLPLP